MSYLANVYYVMLASPSDVVEELKIAREIILDWNVVHSYSKNIVLLPVNWEYSVYSSFGNRPQEILNKQILKNADLLVGIFWTRIGTPTGKAISGTVEEIGEHIKIEKPTMLYFSNRDINPERFDPVQYKAVQDMKNEYQKIGLTHSFNSSEDFKSQFQRQLSLIINNSEYFRSPEGISVNSFSISEDEIKLVLSPEAETLLIECAEDSDGQIMVINSLSGFEVQTNDKLLTEGLNPRTQAKWRSAIEELSTNNLIKDIGYKGEIFALTSEGYVMADQLKTKIK
jgi:hypothetical protein